MVFLLLLRISNTHSPLYFKIWVVSPVYLKNLVKPFAPFFSTGDSGNNGRIRSKICLSTVSRSSAIIPEASPRHKLMLVAEKLFTHEVTSSCVGIS